MGLVIQNNVDALLPVAEPATGPTGQASGPSPTDGVFANLLASLGTTVEAEATDLSLEAALPGAESEAEDGKDESTSSLLAALFPMTTPLQLVKEPLVVVVSQETASAVAGIEAGASTIEALPGETNDAGVVVAEVAAEAPPPVATEAISAEAAAVPTEAAVQAPPPALVSSDSSAKRPELDSGDEPLAPIDGSPPTEAGDASTTEATSVVRSVGNAKTKEDTGSNKGKGNGRKDDPVEGPRASAQGIAHAAANSAVGELRQPAATTVDAPAAPTDAPAPAPAELPQQIDQVAQTVIEQVEAGGGEARIHLDPGDLGEVTIHVRADGDSVSIEVRAERPEAAQLLRDHTQDLSQLLGSRGMNLSDVNVGLGRGNAGEAWGQDGRPQNRPNGGEFASILGGDSAPLETHNRLRAAYNPDGAHMYRV